jgi:hypothetical protein
MIGTARAGWPDLGGLLARDLPSSCLPPFLRFDPALLPRAASTSARSLLSSAPDSGPAAVEIAS